MTIARRRLGRTSRCAGGRPPRRRRCSPAARRSVHLRRTLDARCVFGSPRPDPAPPRLARFVLVQVARQPLIALLGRQRLAVGAGAPARAGSDASAHARATKLASSSSAAHASTSSRCARSAASCACARRRSPKCVTARLRGRHAFDQVERARQARRSMSGGGVGASTGPAPMRTPATSPVNAVPARLVQVGDVVGGVARACKRPRTARASHRHAARAAARPGPRAPRPTAAASARRRACRRSRAACSDRSGAAPRARAPTPRVAGTAAASEPAAPAWSRWMCVSASARGGRCASCASSVSRQLLGPGSTITSPTRQAPITRARPRCSSRSAGAPRRACAGDDCTATR